MNTSWEIDVNLRIFVCFFDFFAWILDVVQLRHLGPSLAIETIGGSWVSNVRSITCINHCSPKLIFLQHTLAGDVIDSCPLVVEVIFCRGSLLVQGVISTWG